MVKFKWYFPALSRLLQEVQNHCIICTTSGRTHQVKNISIPIKAIIVNGVNSLVCPVFHHSCSFLLTCFPFHNTNIHISMAISSVRMNSMFTWISIYPVSGWWITHISSPGKWLVSKVERPAFCTSLITSQNLAWCEQLSMKLQRKSLGSWGCCLKKLESLRPSSLTMEVTSRTR